MNKELFCSTIEKMIKQAKKDARFGYELNLYLGSDETEATEESMKIVDDNFCYEALFDILAYILCKFGNYDPKIVYDVLAEIVFNYDMEGASDLYDEAFGLKNNKNLKNIS